MRKSFFTFIGLLTGFWGISQDTAVNYSKTITAADLKRHLYVIAGPEMEGRETATDGQKKAAAYIESQFKLMGLTPGNNGSFEQRYDLMKDSMLSGRLKIAGKNYHLGRDYMMSADVNQNKKVKSRKVVFAGYGITDQAYNDYNNLDVRGAIVVLASGEPRQNGKYIISGSDRRSAWSALNQKITLAERNGAKAVLVISPTIVTIDSGTASNLAVTRLYLPDKERIALNNLPTATISHQLFRDIFSPVYADSIIGKLDDSQPFTRPDLRSVRKRVSLRYEEKGFIKANSTNVLAMLEGTDKKDEYVLLTAHYDHLGTRGDLIYYGADDDGSGTVAVLEMAEAFAKAKAEGHGPRRTIVFMAVSGEEKGLWGSKYFSENPVVPLNKTSANLNTDMVGRIDPKRTYGDSMNYVYIIGDNKLSTDLKKISEAVNDSVTRLELDYKYNDPKDPERIYYRSDHYNFARKGVPILFYFNGTHADYHRPTDTVEKINYDLMEKRVHLIFLTAWEIANRNDMLKRDIPL